MRKILLLDPSRIHAMNLMQRRSAAAIAEAIVAAKGAPKGAVPRASGGVMIIPLHGYIVHRGDDLSMFLGETPIVAWMNRVEQAINDDDVGGIVLDIDSPGGEVDGVPEAAARLYALRGKKPIVAVANTLAASAAYWIGTAADKLFVTPSGEVGSVGVVAVHVDESRRLEEAGFTVTIFRAGRFKGELSPFEPLTEEARQYETGVISDIYTDFVAAVARHRGTSPANVRASYGEGRLVPAVSAVKEGMADGVRTMQDVVSSMAGTVSAGKRRAEARKIWAAAAARKKFARRP